MSLPPDEVMKMMAAQAWEQATTKLAEYAESAANHTSPAISGPDALRAFAAAIRNNNARHYPKPEVSS